jgi:hypothetical protein
MYVGDRTQLFGKMYKQFDPVTFSILSLVTVAAGLLTVKTINKDPESEPGFLNRNQTDEWKGWMQVMILVYHFTGASGTSGIYNPIRVLVAAYLFQTGYGHFYFFYKKADYGIARILNVMVRLNLLTCVLAYTMDTNYLFYYFSPLVSFWFAAIWVAMFVGYKYNNHGWFILSKIIIMGVITGFIIHYPGILEFIFDFLTWAFKIQWNVTEWRFRLSLDAWIVYVGMICAYISIKISEYKLPAEYPFMWKITKYVSAVLSILGMIGFFWFELSMSKASYNGYQPYISWIPILSFVCLRNCTRLFRNTYSRFFAFIGKISLETFIGQFHMWLAADTTGLLVIIPNASWVIKTEIGWWVNLGVSSLIFVFVCYHLSEATGVITRLLCSGAKEQKSKENYSSLPNPAEATTQDTVPLLPTNSSSGNGNKNEEEEGPDRFNVETEEDESVYLEENVHTNRKVKWYKPIIESISQNYWLRTISFLVGAGIVNRFCS